MTEWRMVPMEPTEEMLNTLVGRTENDVILTRRGAKWLYAMMIEAAPQPPDDELARLEREMGGIINDLLEVAEQAVDTRQCSIGILRAMNGARAYLAKRMEQTS